METTWKPMETRWKPMETTWKPMETTWKPIGNQLETTGKSKQAYLPQKEGRWRREVISPPTTPRSHSPHISNTTPKGFEPLRAEPNGFRVYLLSHSDTVSWVLPIWMIYAGLGMPPTTLYGTDLSIILTAGRLCPLPSVY